MPSNRVKFTFPSNKIMLKKIKAVLLLQTVVTHKNKNNKKKIHIVKLINLLLRSESFMFLTKNYNIIAQQLTAAKPKGIDFYYHYYYYTIDYF